MLLLLSFLLLANADQPPKYTVVTSSSNGPYTISEACGVGTSRWYCDDESFAAGLTDDVGALQADIPAGETLTFSVNFASGIDTSGWGDHPDFAILVETWDYLDITGDLTVSMCGDAACDNEIDTAEWLEASPTESAYTETSWWTDDDSDRVLYKCGATTTATYYIKLDNSHTGAVDAKWYFYPVIDSEGDCYYEDASEAFANLVLILVLVGVGVVVCAIIICCVCMGGTCAACGLCCCAPKKDGGVQMAQTE